MPKAMHRALNFETTARTDSTQRGVWNKAVDPQAGPQATGSKGRSSRHIAQEVRGLQDITILHPSMLQATIMLGPTCGLTGTQNSSEKDTSTMQKPSNISSTTKDANRLLSNPIWKRELI
jgi:hypothetical protein